MTLKSKFESSAEDATELPFMDSENLGIKYELLGFDLEIFFKKGIYKGAHNRYRSLIIVSDDLKSYFSIAPTLKNIIEFELKSKLNDDISIGLLGEKGNLFIVYNHRTNLYKIFPESIDDTGKLLLLGDRKKGLIRGFILYKKLEAIVKNFEGNSIIPKVITELNRL